MNWHLLDHEGANDSPQARSFPSLFSAHQLKESTEFREHVKVLNYFWHLCPLIWVVMGTVIFGSISRCDFFLFFLSLGEERYYEAGAKDETDLWEKRRTNKNSVVKSSFENY